VFRKEAPLHMTEVQGVYAAAITPRGQHGDIDFGASFELIDFLSKGGVSGIALCATVGEFAALTNDERSRLVYLAVKRSRVPVLVGVGSATLDGSVALARAARDAGAAGLLLPPPHFFFYDQDDLREFYLQFAAQLGSGVATFLAQLPGSCTQLETPTMLDLLSTGYFAGLEDGRGADAVLHMKSQCEGKPWRILAADDASFAAARCAGAHGAISSAACALPELMAALDGAIVSRNHAQAQELDARLREFLAWVNQFPQPAILKVATGLRGLKTGPLAVPLSPEKQKKLEGFRSWFEAWLRETKKLAAHG
jgi:4-hydroxy-tetrahydrodipicolinate synthase